MILGRLVGESTDVLLGADLLNLTPLIIDLKNNLFTIPDTGFMPAGKVLNFNNVMGMIVINCRIGGADTEAIVDTGAKISYLSSEHPAAQEFDTP